MTVHTDALRLIVVDEVGVYHRGVELPRGELGTLGCNVEHPRQAQVPPDVSKRLLHDCLFAEPPMTTRDDIIYRRG